MLKGKFSEPEISIHASREGSDGSGYSYLLAVKISIHASREGSDCALKLSPDYRT